MRDCWEITATNIPLKKISPEKKTRNILDTIQMKNIQYHNNGFSLKVLVFFSVDYWLFRSAVMSNRHARKDSRSHDIASFKIQSSPFLSHGFLLDMPMCF